MGFETFKKLPLGGVDRRALVRLLAEQGPRAAQDQLQRERPAIVGQGAQIEPDTAVLILGGSNGLTRAIALQLLFGEAAAVVGVHYDSEKMQIGPHHVRAIGQASDRARFFNCDAIKDKNVAQVVESLRGDFRAVHLINGIAAGAPKRHAQHGPIEVLDLDVAFDPVLQVPDFSRPEHLRRMGNVEVGVASENETRRTIAFMGTSTQLWTDALAEAGLLAPQESVVAFCDYDFPADDPVYGLGPLADAKIEHRRSLAAIRAKHDVRAVRVCYPAMATTALGAIPGALLAYALSTQVLRERGEFVDVPELARQTMQLWSAEPPKEELRLDEPFQRAVDEVRQRIAAIREQDVPDAFARLFEP